MLEQFDIVVLTENSQHFRAGATLTVLEVDPDRNRVRVGIVITDSGEWVNQEDLKKVCK